MNGFEEFKSVHAQEIVNIQEILRRELSDEPELLITQAKECEALYGRSLFLLAKANSYLDQAEWERLPKPSKLMTAMDRRTSIKSSCAPERELRDIIEGLTNATKSRIMLCSTLLNYMRDLYVSQPHLSKSSEAK